MELLTIQETAELLKVSPITVRRYISDGRLPAVKAGKGIRVRKDAIERFLTPIEPKAGKHTPPVRRASKVFTMDDPLWNIVGIIQSDGPTDISENKHKYLADAYDAQEP